MKAVRKREWERRKEGAHGHVTPCSMERLALVTVSTSVCQQGEGWEHQLLRGASEEVGTVKGEEVRAENNAGIGM